MGLLLFLIVIVIVIVIHNPFTIAVAREHPENGIQSLASSAPIPPSSDMETPQNASFKPGITIIVAVISIIFSIIFLLLLYAKHCTRIVYVNNPNGIPISRGNSGINRKVIETLPMFRFSSLRGQKDGLECAVCLTRFEPQEVLKLLPKCKHAFHVECVDTWLDEHSTCPLCRYRVDPEDITQVDNGKGKEIVGTRIVSKRHSSVGEGENSLEIVVENSGRDLKKGRASFDGWRSRRKSNADIKSKSTNSWSAFRRKSGMSMDGQLPVQGDKHRLDHRIIISMGGEEEEKQRWSEVQAADNLYLKSEMILGGEDGRGVINDRSVSEITGMSRYRSKKGGREREEEEGLAKRWMDWLPKSHQQQQKPSLKSASASSSSSTAV